MLFIHYPKCTTCKRAKKWLDEKGVEYTERHIVEDNPTAEELKAWHEKSGLPLKRFFNTSGMKYRELGLKDKLRRFLDESDCHVAISLHSPLHEQRASLMPIEKSSPIEEIVELLRNYDFSHQRRLSFEYIVFDGVNDSMSHAKEVVRLLKGLFCRVNLINFHKIPTVDLRGADHKKMEVFRDYLTSHGVFTTIRASRGEDIYAACGMLTTSIEKGRHTPKQA